MSSGALRLRCLISLLSILSKPFSAPEIEDILLLLSLRYALLSTLQLGELFDKHVALQHTNPVHIENTIQVVILVLQST